MIHRKTDIKIRNTYTMHQKGLDNFNMINPGVLSLMGFITLMSGWTPWYVSSPSVRKLLKRFKRKS